MWKAFSSYVIDSLDKYIHTNLRARKEIGAIYLSGLFDVDWYRSVYPDVSDAGIDPVVHYYFNGVKESRNPSLYFDTMFYLGENRDVRENGVNPLFHYIAFGEKEGRKPSLYFDPGTYPSPTGTEKTKLASYIYGGYRTHKPNPFFDSVFYLSTYPDIKNKSDLDPLRHYLVAGFLENRQFHPKIDFALVQDLMTSSGSAQRDPLKFLLEQSQSDGTLLDQVVRRADPPVNRVILPKGLLPEESPEDPLFEESLLGHESWFESLGERVFAFYLPQYYPFPENDHWWGPGFTEWRNVVRGQPRFKNHQQPHLPRDLGFYDLRNAETIRQQVGYAKNSGITGFCYYYYWFNRKRLLDRPLDTFLKTKDLDFPFCLAWANENWTRTWDGFSDDVLISQDYRDDDDEPLVDDLARYMEDPRYERIGGRPLLVIYRPGSIPNVKTRFRKLADLFSSKYGLEPLFFMAQGFGDENPEKFGLDGAIEFPPHKLAQGLKPVNSQLEITDSGFSGHYMSYDDLVSRSNEVVPAGFDLIRTVVPSWDNEARKPGRGMGFVGSTPDKFQKWLGTCLDWSREHPVRNGRSYVFINAWNEWAEGAFLEPSLRHGCAYLNAVTRARLNLSAATQEKKRLLFVGHDAHPHGAQMLMLNILKEMKASFGIQPVLLLLQGGPLAHEYTRICPVKILNGPDDDSLSPWLAEQKVDRAITNTVVSGRIVKELSDHGVECVSLIHELPRLIQSNDLIDVAGQISMYSSRIVFASQFVADAFFTLGTKLRQLASRKTVILPQGIYQKVSCNPEARSFLKAALGLPAESRLIINLGFGDLRKGFDIFVGLARTICATKPFIHFVWVGTLHKEIETWFGSDLCEGILRTNFHLLPYADDVGDYLNGADLLFLSSREDPFPSVVLEALGVGLPVVGFKDHGGFHDAFCTDDDGCEVAFYDEAALVDAVLRFLQTETEETRGERSIRAMKRFDWRRYVFELLRLAWPDILKISVVVPNYNYARYLPERLESILNQEYPLFEVVVLDDVSSDNSLDVLEDIRKDSGRAFSIVRNEVNSGSVFAQWMRGVKACTGDLVWIAEADDSSDIRFLKEMVRKWNDKTIFAFCDSRIMDSESKIIGESYDFYLKDTSLDFRSDYQTFTTKDFLLKQLSVKNTVLNVSSALFRRKELDEALTRHWGEIVEYKVAGDWFIYTKLMTNGGNVIFSSKKLNTHRRHGRSVTKNLEKSSHYAEIKAIQKLVSETGVVTTEYKKKASDYLREVKETLGQKKESAPSLTPF